MNRKLHSLIPNYFSPESLILYNRNEATSNKTFPTGVGYKILSFVVIHKVFGYEVL